MPTIKVKGMSCQHCVKSVTEAMEKLGAKDVSIDLLVKRLGGKTKFVFDLVRDLFMLCAFAVMVIGGISYMNTLGMTAGASTPIPLAFISVSVPASGLAMGVMVLIKLFQRLFGKTSL